MPEVPVEESQGENEMSKVASDIAGTCLQNILHESLRSHSDLMHDSRANVQSSHNVLRHSGVRKYDKEDPIEGAAVEMILTK